MVARTIDRGLWEQWRDRLLRCGHRDSTVGEFRRQEGASVASFYQSQLTQQTSRLAQQSVLLEQKDTQLSEQSATIQQQEARLEAQAAGDQPSASAGVRPPQ